MNTCKYCQQKTVYVPLTVKSNDNRLRPRTFEVYYCYDCATEYAHFGQVVNTHIYTTINNRMYRWSLEMGGDVGRLWYIGEPGEPGERPNRKLELVKNFKDQYPTITPQNVNEKLRFILLFL